LQTLSERPPTRMAKGGCYLFPIVRDVVRSCQQELDS